MATAARRRGNLKGIAALRGLAALAIVPYHAFVQLFGEGAFHPLDAAYIAVPIFFAMSGFVILYAHSRDLEQPGRLHDFWVKRLARLVPTYWLITTAVILAATRLPGAMRPEKFALGNIARSYLLWPVHDLLYVLPQGWTLPHDMRFYLFFSLLILLPARRWLPWLALLVAGSLVNLGIWFGWWSLGHAAGQPYLIDFVFSQFNLPFLFGALACTAVMYRPLPKHPRRFAELAALALVLAMGIDVTVGFGGYAQRMLAYAVTASLLIYGLAVRDLADEGAHTSKSLLQLGDASYALYLVHLPVIVLGSRIFLRLVPDPSHAAIAILVAVETLISLLVALAWYPRIEQPLFKWLTARFLRRAPVPLTAANER